MKFSTPAQPRTPYPRSISHVSSLVRRIRKERKSIYEIWDLYFGSDLVPDMHRFCGQLQPVGGAGISVGQRKWALCLHVRTTGSANHRAPFRSNRVANAPKRSSLLSHTGNYRHGHKGESGYCYDANAFERHQCASLDLHQIPQQTPSSRRAWQCGNATNLRLLSNCGHRC